MGVKTELCRVERSTTLLTGIDQFLRGQLICGLHHASFYAVLRAEFSARVAATNTVSVGSTHRANIPCFELL